MNQNYESVPNIITKKDLDYLSDMFEWNYGAFKNTHQSIANVQDQNIKKLLQKAKNIFQSNINEILTILNEGGQNE